MERSHLPRLPREFYQGHAFVFWSLAVDERQTGWLNPEFHLQFQLILLHTCSRYSLLCPTYALMPDHAHFLWVGCSPNSNQRNAIEFFQQHTSKLLRPARWQRQPYDHVLRDSERGPAGFRTIADYIRQNPVRAGIVTYWNEYPYCGSTVPGYPNLLLQQEDYWERFWRIYGKRCDTEGRHSLTLAATSMCGAE